MSEPLTVIAVSNALTTVVIGAAILPLSHTSVFFGGGGGGGGASLPPGGNAGDVLSKNTPANGDVAWKPATIQYNSTNW